MTTNEITRQAAIDKIKATMTPSQILTALAKADKEAARTAQEAADNWDKDGSLNAAACKADLRRAYLYAATL